MATQVPTLMAASAPLARTFSPTVRNVQDVIRVHGDIFRLVIFDLFDLNRNPSLCPVTGLLRMITALSGLAKPVIPWASATAFRTVICSPWLCST